jgi:hypothetical protein
VQPHGIAGFQDFGVGQAGIGHVCVDGIGPVALSGRSTAAAGRFVIPERRVAEEQVVHGALACGSQAESAEQHVHNPLGRFDVAADDRRAILRLLPLRRIEQTLGHDDLDRREDALVERNVFTNEQP